MLKPRILGVAGRKGLKNRDFGTDGTNGLKRAVLGVVERNRSKKMAQFGGKKNWRFWAGEGKKSGF